MGDMRIRTRKPRTPLQSAANDFDADLYGLMEAASRHEWNLRDSPDAATAWNKVARALHDARPYVRNMMHADDLKETL